MDVARGNFYSFQLKKISLKVDKSDCWPQFSLCPERMSLKGPSSSRIRFGLEDQLDAPDDGDADIPGLKEKRFAA